jgi:hypothetical protein
METITTMKRLFAHTNSSVDIQMLNKQDYVPEIIIGVLADIITK